MKEIRKVNLADAYNGSYYTILGAGGDLQEWVDGYEKWLEEKGIGKPKAWFTCKGKDINEGFGLIGSNAFKDDLTCLFFPLDELNIGGLAMFKLAHGDRWFDDIIDNSLEREQEEEM